MEYFSNDDLDTQDTINTEASGDKDPSFSEEYFQTSSNSNTMNNSRENVSKPIPNIFAFFAKNLGIFSIICAFFSLFFGAFICGGLAIVLAVLSKGYNTKMEKNAKIGIATGIIGMVLQISVLTFSIYKIVHVPEFRERFNSMYEQIYGQPVDDSINDILDQMGVPAGEGDFL